MIYFKHDNKGYKLLFSYTDVDTPSTVRHSKFRRVKTRAIVCEEGKQTPVLFSAEAINESTEQFYRERGRQIAVDKLVDIVSEKGDVEFRKSINRAYYSNLEVIPRPRQRDKLAAQIAKQRRQQKAV